MSLIRRLFVSPSRLDQPCLAMFIFNADEISTSHGSMYGAYASDALKGCLLSVVTQATNPTEFYAYHGDLFERVALPHPKYGDKPLDRLRAWLSSEKWGANSDLLEPSFADDLKRGSPLGFVPFAIVLKAFQRGDMLHVDGALKSHGTTGYKGAILFRATAPHSEVARFLALPSMTF